MKIQQQIINKLLRDAFFLTTFIFVAMATGCGKGTSNKIKFSVTNQQQISNKFLRDAFFITTLIVVAMATGCASLILS